MHNEESAIEAELVPSRHAEVLAEIDALRDHKPGWGTGLSALVVSLLLFLGLGAVAWDWKLVILLIPTSVVSRNGASRGDALVQLSKPTHVLYPTVWRGCVWTELQRPGLEEGDCVLDGPIAWSRSGNRSWPGCNFIGPDLSAGSGDLDALPERLQLAAGVTLGWRLGHARHYLFPPLPSGRGFSVGCRAAPAGGRGRDR